MNGVISNMIPTKKFGFISGDNGQEYFFHYSEVLVDWDLLLNYFTKNGGGKVKVTFEAVKTPKGPRARNVTLAESSAA
jgi:cold shock CspA family protein